MQRGSRDRSLDDPRGSASMLRAMAEAAEVGARIGCPIHQGGEERRAVTRQLGDFRTSMLQDAEAGRPLELDALVGAVSEIGVATPHIDTLLGLARAVRAGVRQRLTRRQPRARNSGRKSKIGART